MTSLVSPEDFSEAVVASALDVLRRQPPVLRYPRGFADRVRYCTEQLPSNGLDSPGHLWRHRWASLFSPEPVQLTERGPEQLERVVDVENADAPSRQPPPTDRATVEGR